MKRSTKAVLLSAFVFPGVGHLYLRQFVIGIVLSGGSAGALYYIISSAVSKALEIAETIQSEGMSLDVEVIVNLVTEQSHGTESISLSIASIALIAFWVIGIVDLYRMGRVLEKIDVAPLDKKT